MILTLGMALLLAAPVSLIQIEVVSGEGAVHPAGAKTSTGLAVRVVDNTGSPVAGALVSFRLPDDGPGGAFVSGLATELVTTRADGRAVAPAARWNALQGPVEIRVLAAKDDLRAGAVVLQHLAERPAGTAPAVGRSRFRSKWAYLAGIAAAGAAIGFVGGRASGPPAAAAPGASDTDLDIGAPTVVIGKP
ncbi:MAG TPA: hypothetical protein VN428_14400 [Bryobacteraceae bacterium]|nr:hypothetical protein [Bryobacteraceae bacterium]